MDEEFVEGVFAKLLDGRRCVERARSGVYGIFAKDLEIFTADQGCSVDIELAKSGIVYIGKASDLIPRNHFNATCSSSTLRLSIGAVLREELGLGAAHEKSKKFRFTDKGERRLSDWMCANLEYSFYRFDGMGENPGNLENELIRKYTPPFNLNGWRGSRYRKKIQCFRGECKDEALVNWQKAKENA